MTDEETTGTDERDADAEPAKDEVPPTDEERIAQVGEQIDRARQKLAELSPDEEEAEPTALQSGDAEEEVDDTIAPPG